MIKANPVKHCAILADPVGPAKEREIQAASQKLAVAFEQLGVTTTLYLNRSPEKIQPPVGTDLFLVLGGDGTMIHFAGPLNHFQIPFYGLNFGYVGFMMNTRSLSLEQHAAIIAAGDFYTCNFPLLTVQATDRDGSLHNGYGLNDIYLQRQTPQTCKVNIFLNDEPLPINPLLCDGVIVATPLGSTAYSFNVSGSMIAIDSQVMMLTLVAPSRSCPVGSMVLPLSSRIRFEILEPDKRRVMVVNDGFSQGNLVQAEVSISPRTVQLGFEPKSSDNLSMRLISKACGR